jgi:hypothetical protein
MDIEDSEAQGRALEACRTALAPERQEGKGYDYRLACAAGRSLGDIELKEFEELRQKAIDRDLDYEARLLERLQNKLEKTDPEWAKVWAEQRAAVARIRTFEASKEGKIPQ